MERTKAMNEDMQIAQYDEVRKLTAENERLRGVLLRTASSLIAAVSSLESGGRKTAASDKMFEQMLRDYKESISEVRAEIIRWNWMPAMSHSRRLNDD